MAPTSKATRPGSTGETNPTGQQPIMLRVIEGGKEKELQGSTEPQEGLSPIFEITVMTAAIVMVVVVLILDWAVPVVAQ